MREVLLDPNKTEQEQFAVWRQAMSPSLDDKEVLDMMNTAKQNLVQFHTPKPRRKASDIKEHIAKMRPLLKEASMEQKYRMLKLLKEFHYRSVEPTEFNAFIENAEGVAEGHKESYIIVRTDREGKKDVFAGNFDTYEQAQKELDACLAHPLHTKYKQKFEIKRKGQQGVTEAFNQPYQLQWDSGEFGDYDAYTQLPDGSNLSIMFNREDEDVYSIEFWRSNSQEVTGEGDAQRIFATVLNAIQTFLTTKEQPRFISFTGEKGEETQDKDSRVNLYSRMVKRYAASWGYRVKNVHDRGDAVTFDLMRIKQDVAEKMKMGATIEPMEEDDIISHMVKDLTGKGAPIAKLRAARDAEQMKKRERSDGLPIEPKFDYLDEK
jgi:hypothetical protein